MYIEKWSNDLVDSITKNTKLYIITKKFTLKAFEFIFSKVNEIDSIKIIITDDFYYSNGVVNSNLFYSEFEKECFSQLNDQFIAHKYIQFFKEKVEIKTIQNTNKKIYSWFCLLETNNKKIIYDSTIEFSLNGFGIIEDNIWNNIDKKTNLDEFNFKYNKFKEIWFSNDLISTTNIYIDKLVELISPLSVKDLYYFNLFHIFNENMSKYEDKNLDFNYEWKNTKIYKMLYDFQKNAVYGIIDKIEKFNGCILADSVGLGKTFEALAVIKYFELKRKKVLVLCPKRLRNNWEQFLQSNTTNLLIDDNFNFKIMNHTDLGRRKGKSGNDDISNFDWGSFDLVVIDESHNFRNNNWANDNQKNKTRYQFLMEKIILEGRKTNVLLLSATPVNNNMYDIKNQINFITANNDNAFDKYQIKSVSHVCIKAESQCQKWSQLDEKFKTTEMFEKMIGLQFKKLINLITIARSRKQIIQTYKNVEINFATRLKPCNYKVDIDTSNNVMNISELNSKLISIIFSVYKCFNYIKPQYIDLYEKNYKEQFGNKFAFKEIHREENIVKLMRINILKRFESSIESFRLTIKNIIDKSEMIFEWLNSGENKSKFNFDDYDIDNLNDDEEDVNKIRIIKEHLDVLKYKDDLKYDINELKNIYNEYYSIDYKRDAKIQQLLSIIENKWKNPINLNNKKIIIFTAFSDTAKYLYNYLSKKYEENGVYSALITGDSCKTNHILLKNKICNTNELLTYFSPSSKKINLTNLDKNINIDILIATDCISEGQNLQDCDFLINYDIHWNPVRLIQRFGRIDRIGSINNVIQLVNIWPNVELDEYIKLESKIQNKLQKISITSTSEENLINENSHQLNQKIKQLKQISNEIIDLEEMKGDIAFSNLTFSDFTMDLKMYLENNYHNISNKSIVQHSLVKTNDSKIEPGIILLLKNNKTNNEDNLIDPYYLIYINYKNEIKYSYNSATSILMILKSLAKNSSSNQLEKETCMMNDLNKHNELIKNAINKINEEKQISNFEILFDETSKFNNFSYNFELLSYLIIR